MQLNLLLHSIRRNVTGFDKILVTFNYSDDKFFEGYKRLMKKGLADEWRCDKGIAYTSEFRNHIIDLIGDEYEYICFFSDDDIVYKKVSISELVPFITDDVISFPLRAGLNASYSFYGGETIIENPWGDYKDFGNFIKWNWTEYNPKRCNGYPIAFGDGGIFKTEVIRNLLKNVEGQSPNELERHLNTKEIRETITQHYLVAYKHSVLVSTPVNNVNTFSPLFHGEKFSYPVAELNELYLKGYIINYDKIDFSNIKGTHQELSLPLRG